MSVQQVVDVDATVSNASLLVLLVYFSEFINEIAARNAHRFSKQQYFDSQGLFISVIFSSPILLNCLFLLARFLHQNLNLLTKVKVAEIKYHNQMKRRQNQAVEERPKVE